MPTDNSIRYVIRRKSDGLYFKKTRHPREGKWVKETIKAKLYQSPVVAKNENLGRFCWKPGDHDLRLSWEEHKEMLAKRFHVAYEVVPVQVSFKEF